jgi:hypothetical protein
MTNKVAKSRRDGKKNNEENKNIIYGPQPDRSDETVFQIEKFDPSRPAYEKGNHLQNSFQLAPFIGGNNFSLFNCKKPESIHITMAAHAGNIL